MQGPRLRFAVRGSTGTVYAIVAEGAGASFRIYCRCPASERGGRMCRHAAALLMGEVGDCIDGAGEVERLADMAAGSFALKAALSHAPEPRGAPSLPLRDPVDLAASLAPVIDMLRAAGLHVEAGRAWVRVHPMAKSGRRPLKHPVLSIGISGRWRVDRAGHGPIRFKEVGRAAYRFVAEAEALAERAAANSAAR